MKKVIVSISIAVLALVAGLFGFLLLNTVKEKEFEGRGVKVTLSSDYKVRTSEEWDFYVENDEIAFMSNRLGKLSQIQSEGGTLSLQSLSLQAYLTVTLAAYKIEEKNISIYKVQKYDINDDFYYCFYSDAEKKYGYLLLVKESENFFYTINIACENEKLPELRDELLAIAVSVKVE